MSLNNSNKYSTISLMNIVESNTIQKTLLIYIEVDSFNQKEKLEKSYDEFYSLAHSSGVEIVKATKFKQKIPITSSFISKGKLDQIKNELIDLDVDLILLIINFLPHKTETLKIFLLKE